MVGLSSADNALSLSLLLSYYRQKEPVLIDFRAGSNFIFRTLFIIELFVRLENLLKCESSLHNRNSNHHYRNPHSF